MTHRGPFQPLLFCDSVMAGEGVIFAIRACVRAHREEMGRDSLSNSCNGPEVSEVKLTRLTHTRA